MNIQLGQTSGWIGPAIAISIMLLFWEAIATQIPSYLLPSPTTVAKEIIEGRKSLAIHVATTASESIIGFAIANATSLILAVMFVFSRGLKKSVYPLVVALKSVPIVAVAPLLVIWLGYGYVSKVAMASIIAFFPLLISATLGLTRVDPLYLDLMRSLGASPLQVLTLIRLPNAIPDIIAGMKISAPLAVMGAIVAEMTGGERGLGSAILLATMRLDTSRAFAAIVCACILGILFFFLTSILETLLIPQGTRTSDQGGV